MSRLGLLIAALAAAASFVLFDDRAAATTFCVPNFSAACVNNGANVAEADLEKAMGLNSSDGMPDKIIVAAGTRTEDGTFEPSSGFKNPGTYEPAGSDPLTIVGAGTDSTILTSGGTGNIFLLSLGSALAREITVEDLTIQVPVSFEDGGGAAIQLYTKDTLEDVEIVSLNKESDAVIASGPGNFARRVVVRAGGSGSIEYGVGATSESASVTVEDSRIEGASWGLVAGGSKAELTARRVTAVGTRTYGAISTGGTVAIENSVLQVDDGVGLHASAAASDALVDADHVTVRNSGGSSYPALEVARLSAAAGKISLDVSNSILRGFKEGYKVENKAGSGLAALSVRFSNFQKTGTNNALNTSLDLATGNIDLEPLFNPDFSLQPTSPGIDQGDPAAGGLLTDFLGAPRPNDGDGDGVAVRDQGAFEYQRPKPPVEEGGGGTGGGGTGGSGSGGGTGGGPVLDTAAPLTKLLAGPGKGLAQGKAKFRFGSSEAGSRFECKLDRGKARPCSSPKVYSGLRPGRHTFKVWAIDAAGNRAAKPTRRSFRVPG